MKKIVSDKLFNNSKVSNYTVARMSSRRQKRVRKSIPDMSSENDFPVLSRSAAAESRPMPEQADNTTALQMMQEYNDFHQLMAARAQLFIEWETWYRNNYAAPFEVKCQVFYNFVSTYKNLF